MCLWKRSTTLRGEKLSFYLKPSLHGQGEVNRNLLRSAYLILCAGTVWRNWEGLPTLVLESFVEMKC